MSRLTAAFMALASTYKIAKTIIEWRDTRKNFREFS